MKKTYKHSFILLSSTILFACGGGSSTSDMDKKARKCLDIESTFYEFVNKSIPSGWKNICSFPINIAFADNDRRFNIEPNQVIALSDITGPYAACRAPSIPINVTSSLDDGTKFECT